MTAWVVKSDPYPSSSTIDQEDDPGQPITGHMTDVSEHER